MSIGSYILDDDNNPVSEPDTLKWGRWLEDNLGRKKVANTVLNNGRVVSTVFLGLDHRFGEAGPPLLFETMIFVSEEDYTDLYMERYTTWNEAEAGHERCCQMTEPYYDE